MPSLSRKQRPTAHDVAGEIIRRVTAANAQTGGGYVVRLSKPPTLGERLQLIAARLERRPVVILPHKCSTVDEWLEQYASQEAGASAGR